MTFFELDDPKEEAAARFVADVGRSLQEALVERKLISKLTQQEIARRLGVDRSAVNKQFSGYRNLTLESLAELCWAMDVEPTLKLVGMLDKSANDTSLMATNGRVQSTNHIFVADGRPEFATTAPSTNRAEIRRELSYAS